MDEPNYPSDRAGCWMTFSEALEAYLVAREASQHFGAGRNRDGELANMKIAANHMDVLTDSMKA